MEEERGNRGEEEKEHSNKKKKRKNNKSGKALNVEDENENVCSLSPTISTVGMRSDLTNVFMNKEFVQFLRDEGIDVNLMDSEKVKDLKRKYGEVEILRSEFEFKQAILLIKLQNIKFQQYQTALQKFS